MVHVRQVRFGADSSPVRTEAVGSIGASVPNHCMWRALPWIAYSAGASPGAISRCSRDAQHVRDWMHP